MEDSKTAYTLPEDFNPWITLDALRGLADGINYVLHYGAGTQEQMDYGDWAALDGLAGLLQERMHALHDYFSHVSDVTTLKLPLTEADFEAVRIGRPRDDETTEDETTEDEDFIREEPALYLVR